MKPSEMKSGDLVKLTDSPFGWAKVTRVTDRHVTMFRPWMSKDTSGDGSDGYPFIGVEIFDLWRDSTYDYEVKRDNY